VPHTSDRPRRVTIDRDGPLVVEGPVEVVMEDGSVVTSHRFAVALCTCRRSRTYPWCDTSHRRRVRAGPQPHGSGSRRSDAAGTGNAEDTQDTEVSEGAHDDAEDPADANGAAE
jgi:CDGSH-type Zn-finger protein